MAISNVNHFRLLNVYPRIMQINQWHWNQITGKGAPLAQQCSELFIQDERDMIASVLNQAVEETAHHLGFYPRPVWITERVNYGRNWLAWQELKTRYGYIEAFGVRTTSLIDDNVTVVYSDTNSDGVLDLATITVTTNVDVSEIELFFRTADGAPSVAHEYWGIEPFTTISASGGVVTITAPRYLFVKPNRIWSQPYDEPNYTVKHGGDTESVQDFVTGVDVYRVYADATAAIQLTSDPILTRCTDLDEAIVNNGLALILDSRLGIFRTRIECPTCFSYPESVWISYKAGYPLDVNRNMDRRLELAMCRLSNTFLPYQPEFWCETPLSMWQWDNEEMDISTLSQFDAHPFGGIRRGRIEAWQRIKHLVLGSGSSL